MRTDTAISPKFFRDYPHRVPDWRWQQVIRRVNLHSDDYVNIATKFYIDLMSAKETNDFQLVYAEYPDLYLAWDIYSEVIGNRKGELEARILARESLDIIAKKLSMPVPAIISYEATFFNVLDRLDSPGYILHFAIGEINQPQDMEFDSRFWKFYGYWCGPEVLDYLVYKAIPTKLDSDADIDKLIVDRIRKHIVINLTSGSIKDKGILTKFLDLYAKRMEQLRMVGHSADEQAVLSKLGDVLLSINWQNASEVFSRPADEQQLLLDDLIGQNNSDGSGED